MRIASAKARGLGQVRGGGLAPDQVGVGRVGEAAGDGAFQAAAQVEEALRGALPVADELAVAWVDVGEEELGAVGVGAGHEQGRDVAHVGGEAGCDQGADELAGGHQHLAAHVAALLLRGDLVLEVNTGCTGVDHRLHQLEGVERTTKASLGVGEDGCEPVVVVLALGVVDLISAAEGLVDLADHVGNGVDRVEALVGVHLAGGVGVGGHLPAREIDGLQPGADLLHGLVAGESSERGHVVGGVQELPETARTELGEGVGHLDRPAEALDVGTGIRPDDALEATGMKRLDGVPLRGNRGGRRCGPFLHHHRNGHGRRSLLPAGERESSLTLVNQYTQ